jgi:ribosomal protein S18 acetylase RimI-like enzyme
MKPVYRPADARDLPAVRKLFEDYAASLEIDLAFQGFAAELDGLPGKYAPPRGAIILAERDGEPCGCVALRPIDGQTCEMKRLFVRESGRGLGVGRGLVSRILDEARARGYAAMRLDTLPSMQSAARLYRSFGFQETTPYVHNPIPGALFLEKSLAERQESGSAPRGTDAHR